MGFTSEEELKRGVGKCPTSKECGQIGGECFPKKCPGGYEKIGCIGCNASVDVFAANLSSNVIRIQLARLKGEDVNFQNAKKVLQKLADVNPADHFPANAASSLIPNLKYLFLS